MFFDRKQLNALELHDKAIEFQPGGENLWVSISDPNKEWTPELDARKYTFSFDDGLSVTEDFTVRGVAH